LRKYYRDFYLEEMGELYDRFVDAGSESLGAALEAGIGIEVMDIADLTAALVVLAPEGVPRDIQNVLTNLINGSYNHLEAFQDALKRETAQ